MPSPVTLAAGTIVEDTSIGTQVYINDVNNAKTLNGVEATTQALGAPFGGELAHGLKFTNFGFSIPAGATIDGVVVDIWGRDIASSGNTNAWHLVQLVKGGVISGSNLGSDSIAVYPFNSQQQTFGSSTSLWGLSLSVSDVNASDFGFVVQYKGTNGGQISTDYGQVTVYYTEASGGTNVAVQYYNLMLAG